MSAPKKGQKITAAWAKQLLNLNAASLSQGAIKAGGAVISEPGQAKGFNVNVFVKNTGGELPPFSIVGIKTPTNTDEDSLIYLDSTLDASTISVSVGPQTVPAGGLFIPIWIGNAPVRVKASDAGFVVGETCGRPDGETTVSAVGSEFIVIKQTVESDCIYVVSKGGEGSDPGAESGCPCTCISTGDIVVGGVLTASRWTVTYGSAQVFTQTNGKVTLPAGTYIVVYDATSSTWVLDVGDELTAAYHSGVDATADSTLDGTLTMTWVSGLPSEVELCVTADIPEEPGGS